MTHYQKLTTIIFRVIGLIFLIFGTLGAIISLIFFLSREMWAILIGLVYGLLPMIFGIIFFSFSRRFAKWVCFDFDKYHE